MFGFRPIRDEVTPGYWRSSSAGMCPIITVRLHHLVPGKKTQRTLVFLPPFGLTIQRLNWLFAQIKSSLWMYEAAWWMSLKNDIAFSTESFPLEY